MRRYQEITISGLVGFLALTSSVLAQGNATAKNEGAIQIPENTLGFADEKPLVGFPHASVIGYPLHCSSSGTTYVEVFGDDSGPSIKLFPDIYQISPIGDVKKINPKLPIGYVDFSLRDFFAGEHSIVTLFSANPAVYSANEGHHSHVFLSISDPDGDNSKLIELNDLRFDPLKIAVLDSGDFLALGLDAANRLPVLAILNDGGGLRRTVDLEDKKYEEAGAAKQPTKADPGATRVSESSLRSVLKNGTFVPLGSKVLLVQASSDFPLRLIGQGGEERGIKLAIPSGLLLEGAVASNDQTSVVMRLRLLEDISKFAASHVVENPKEVFVEFDLATGRPKRRLTVTGPEPAEVSCATDKKLTAIYYDSITPSTSGTNQKPNSPPSDNSKVETDQIVIAHSPLP